MKHYLEETILELERDGRFSSEKEYMQHGSTSIYEHSINVALTSLLLAQKLNLDVDERSLIRGALLHDYFLYDWHDSDKERSFHGFTHADEALKNAKEDYTLNRTEENIICRHMFPLTPMPPACKEAWLVCMADKYCAVKETVSPYIRKLKLIKI